LFEFILRFHLDPPGIHLEPVGICFPPGSAWNPSGIHLELFSSAWICLVPTGSAWNQWGTVKYCSGAGYAQDRGLGFSLEAAPSWDADALFQMDKAGPRPSQDAREQGLKEKQKCDRVT